MPNGYMMDPATAAYQTAQHNSYMSNYRHYDMNQMQTTGSYMNSAAAAGYGSMYGSVSGGQTSPYGTLQQPGSPNYGIQQQPASPYSLNQGGGSQMSCQSHSPSESSIKSEPVSPSPTSIATNNNNHVMKREYIQQPVQHHELSHLMNMYQIPESIPSSEHQRLIHYQHSASPDLQAQQQQLRMAPLAHMWDQLDLPIPFSHHHHRHLKESGEDLVLINHHHYHQLRENGCGMDISAI